VVHLDAPLEVCRKRDVDGHYPQADKGELTLFPGVSAPYETPEKPDLVLKTDKLGVEECVEQILKLLEEKGILG